MIEPQINSRRPASSSTSDLRRREQRKGDLPVGLSGDLPVERPISSQPELPPPNLANFLRRTGEKALNPRNIGHALQRLRALLLLDIEHGRRDGLPAKGYYLNMLL